MLWLVGVIGLAGCGPAPTDGDGFASNQSVAPKTVPATRAPTVDPFSPEPAISVTVSPDFRAIHYVYEGYLTRGKNIYTELPAFNDGKDTYVVETRVSAPGVSFIIIDDRDRQANKPDPEYLEQHLLSGQERFKLMAAPSDQGTLMYVANMTDQPVWLSIRIDRTGYRPPSVNEPLAKYISSLPRAVAIQYRVPALKIEVEPCGFENAIATSERIVLCSELVNDLIEHDEFAAIHPILAHELAHKLLWSWRIPGWDDEDLADEFAGVIFAQPSEGPEKELAALIQWLERRDPVAERLARDAGDTHSLGIERAQALRRILANPAPYTARWNERLAAFRRTPAVGSDLPQ